MTRNEIIKMAREAGIFTTDLHCATATIDIVERFAALVAEAEREACTKVLIENAELCTKNKLLREILEANADAIRARGAA